MTTVAQLDHALAKAWRRLPDGMRSAIAAAYERAALAGLPLLENPSLPADYDQVSAQLSVIVPIHNAYADVQRCLRTLQRFQGQAQVILADDGSTDPRIGPLLDQYLSDGWQVTRHLVGTKHSAACTRGVALAGRTVLCLLNSDTVVTQTSFYEPVRMLLDDDRIGAVGPIISQGYGQQLDLRLKRCRYRVSDAQIFGRASWRARRYVDWHARDLPGFVDGCAFFIRRETFEAVGGFSGCRPHLGNDVDLCAKLRARGLRIMCCESAFVHHLGGRSSA